MKGHSRPVSSNQGEVHARLEHLVRLHTVTPWHRPPAGHSLQAFTRLLPRLRQADRLILDAGCGTGDSSRRLARIWPDHLVLGVDRSMHRLSRRRPNPEPDNLVLVRADLQDFWRLLHDAGLRLERHYLLYPNPWPKKKHLRRRWHGHPVFPWLLALGGVLELRSNWRLYVDEFEQALKMLAVPVSRFQVSEPGLSPFEYKYALSGQGLYGLRADLRATAIPVPGPTVFPVEGHRAH